MRIMDWSSDVCSSDLATRMGGQPRGLRHCGRLDVRSPDLDRRALHHPACRLLAVLPDALVLEHAGCSCRLAVPRLLCGLYRPRSEEHTSELQSLMRISYAVFCLKKKNTNTKSNDDNISNTHKNKHVTATSQ